MDTYNKSILKDIQRVDGIYNVEAEYSANIQQVYFKLNTTFYNVIQSKISRIKKAIMKVVIDYKNIDIVSTREGEIALAGVYYEYSVYKNIILPLLEHKISPNFIQPLSFGNISAKEYKNMLLGSHLKIKDFKNDKWVDTGKVIDNKNVDSIMNRVIHGMVSEFGINPPVNLYISEEYRSKYRHDDIDFIYFMIPFLEKKYTLEKFLNDIDFSTETLYNVLLQIFIAIYTLTLTKTVHNDLHFDNIFIVPIKETLLTYIVNGAIYTFKTTVLVKIYDFDRSFSANLGYNIFLENYCENYFQCNKFNYKFDFTKVLCILTSTHPEYVKSIMIENFPRDKFLYSEYCFFKDEICKLVPDPKTIIHRAASHVKLIRKISLNKYTVDERFFVNGKLENILQDISTYYPIFINIPILDIKLSSKADKKLVNDILKSVLSDKSMINILRKTPGQSMYIPLDKPDYIGKIYTAIAILLQGKNCKKFEYLKI